MNFDESKDLKDLTIPYKRSKELHDWLEEKNINDENLLANLYKREFAYIKILTEACNFKNVKICIEEVKKIISLMN